MQVNTDIPQMGIKRDRKSALSAFWCQGRGVSQGLTKEVSGKALGSSEGNPRSPGTVGKSQSAVSQTDER